MARSIWSGMISFGLVTLPVKLYPATHPRDVRFHEFDARTGRRIRHRRVVEDAYDGFREGPPDGSFPDRAWEPEPRSPGGDNDDIGETGVPDLPSPGGPGPSSTGREVPFSEVALGYEVEPGRTVLLSREEMRALRPERSRSIEIEEFVDLADIDPISFEKSYYAVPQPAPGGDRVYGLLVAALERSNKVGIGRIVLRTKEHLTAIRSWRGVLVLDTLFHADEVRDPSEVYRPPADPVASVSERELQLAEQLIGVLAAAWDPARFEDRDRERLLKLIQHKAGTGTIPTPETLADSAANVSDLMEALRASVEALKEQQRASQERHAG